MRFSARFTICNQDLKWQKRLNKVLLNNSNRERPRILSVQNNVASRGYRLITLIINCWKAKRQSQKRKYIGNKFSYFTKFLIFCKTPNSLPFWHSFSSRVFVLYSKKGLNSLLFLTFFPLIFFSQKWLVLNNRVNWSEKLNGHKDLHDMFACGRDTNPFDTDMCRQRYTIYHYFNEREKRICEIVKQ